MSDVAFKYPVGAEVKFRQQCVAFETHLTSVVVLSAFTFVDRVGGVHNFYAVCQPNVVGGKPFCIHENLIIGRVNVRGKKDGAKDD